MSLNATLTVKYKVHFQIQNGCMDLFDSKELKGFLGTEFTQSFGDLFSVPATAVDLDIGMDGIGHAQMIFFTADTPMLIKFVVQGQTTDTTAPFQLYPGLPSLLSAQNIVGIYVTNSTGQAAQLLIQGVGIPT
jgi:hypothetical protein